MRNILIQIAYDGTNYCGWQMQKNAVSVQEKIEDAIEKVCKEYSFVEGCGRTDAKVHALCYSASFKTKSTIPCDRLPFALNTALPEDVRVLKAFDVKDDFHARFSAVKKTYRYEISTRPIPDPFLRNYAWHYPYPLDFELMKKEAQKFVGTHDFLGFMASGGQVKTTVRTIYSFEIFREGEKIIFEVTGNGFLYNMVRIMTGTLVYIGGGKIKEDLTDIINSKDRNRAGITAPPHGLYMKKVYYEEIFE